jgi:hypothetical protein
MNKNKAIGQSVHLKGDLLVTDPCYICKEDFWPTDDFYYGGVKNGVYMVSPTGVGDLSGGVFLDGKEIGEYGVDAGVFGVFSVNAIKQEEWFDAEKYKELVEKSPWCFTIVPDVEIDLSLDVDKPGDDNWGDLYKMVGTDSGGRVFEVRATGW